MVKTEEKAEKIELCPLCREGLLKIRANGSDPCNYCGAIYDFSLGKVIESNPVIHPSVNKIQTYRIRKRKQQELRNIAADRNFAFALSELERLGIANDLPKNVRESSVAIYRKAISNNMLRGRSIELVAAATTYAACRICGLPRTLDEVAESGGLGKRELGRTYRYISKGLKLNLMPAKPQEYVKRLCIGLNAGDKITELSIKLLDEVEKKGKLSGPGPNAMSAGAVYIASIMCETPFSQREISSAANLTRISLRNSYRKIAETLNIKIIFHEEQ